MPSVVFSANGGSLNGEKASGPILNISPVFDDTKYNNSLETGHRPHHGAPGQHDDGDDEPESEVDDEEDEEVDFEVEEDEDEEDEEEDEEPALKYERIGGSVPDLLKKDSASALAISKKTMVYDYYIPSFHF